MINVINNWADRPGNLFDCCKFAGECIEAVHGYNPANEWDVNSEADARRVIDKHGSLAAIATQSFGQPISEASIRDGDFSILKRADGVEIAAVVYQGVLAVRTAYGVTSFSLAHAVKFWAT